MSRLLFLADSEAARVAVSVGSFPPRRDRHVPFTHNLIQIRAAPHRAELPSSFPRGEAMRRRGGFGFLTF